jgi:hypothetical protein
MKRWTEEMKSTDIGPFAERHLQGFALVNFFSAGGELRFGVDQVTLDRTPKGKPYAIVGGTYYET